MDVWSWGVNMAKKVVSYLKQLKNQFSNKTEASQKDLWPQHKSFHKANPNRQAYFYLGIILKVILKKEVKIDHTKIDPADLNSPRQELSVHSLGFVITLLVRWQINFLCASTLEANSSIEAWESEEKWIFQNCLIYIQIFNQVIERVT